MCLCEANAHGFDRLAGLHYTYLETQLHGGKHLALSASKKKGITVKKKIMLLALAVVNAAAVVLPAGASAAENHLTNVNSFSGTISSTTIVSQEEPVITCGDATNINHVTGTVSAGGTTGTMAFDITGCHTSVFGFTAKCRTEGSPLDNTISWSGNFHLITTNLGKSAILITPVHKTVICAGISNTTTTGNLIGTTTKPACGATSNSWTIKFASSGPTQEHKTYTGVNYNLTSQTGTSGAIKETGISWEATMTSPTAATLDCT